VEEEGKLQPEKQPQIRPCSGTCSASCDVAPPGNGCCPASVASRPGGTAIGTHKQGTGYGRVVVSGCGRAVLGLSEAFRGERPVDASVVGSGTQGGGVPGKLWCLG